MIYIFAGHNYSLPQPDPGAIGVGGIKEADLTIEFRNLVVEELKELGAKFTIDDDKDTLRDILKKIKPGSGSVLLEIHFNSSANLASGTEVLVADKAEYMSRSMAQEICNAQASILGLSNRGVRTEKQSKRGKLAILNTGAGISALTEICFINNPKDVEQHNKNKKVLAYKIAHILQKYDNLYN